jgi:hypothetical protein
MIDAILNSNVGYAVAGGFVYGSIFALRAIQKGDSLDPVKFSVTIVFSGLLGLVFEILGYRPSTYEWFMVLFSYTGLIAGLEQSIKLALRGYSDQARDVFGDALDEGAEATGGLVGSPRQIEGELQRRTPAGLWPEDEPRDLDGAYQRAREESGGWTDPAYREEGRRIASDEDIESRTRQTHDPDVVVADGP